MFKFNLKSGYHHVNVHPDFHKFLGFQWEKKKFCFCCTSLWAVHSLLFVCKAFETVNQVLEGPWFESYNLS